MISPPGNRALIILAALVAAGWLTYLLLPVLFPFAAGFGLAYLLNPAVELCARCMRRTLAVTLVFGTFSVVFTLAGVWVGSAASRQFQDFARNAPRYIEYIETRALPWVTNLTSSDESLKTREQKVAQTLEHSGDVGRFATQTAGRVLDNGAALAAWVANFLFIPFIAFYLLCDWPVLIERLRSFFPRAYAATIEGLVKESDARLAACLRGQLLVMLALAILYSAGLAIVGVQPAILLGLFAGAVSFVPYLGLLAGGTVAVLAAVIQHQDYLHPLLALGVFFAAQILEETVLTPYLVGRRINLRPVTVILAVMAGSVFFGIAGFFFALPIMAIGTVWLTHAAKLYRESDFYLKK